MIPPSVEAAARPPHSMSNPCNVPYPSLYRSLRRTENAGWSEEQEHEQYRQRGNILQSGSQRKHRERLRQSERDPAEKCAKRPPEPADDRRDESGDRERGSDVERGELGGSHQDAGDS